MRRWRELLSGVAFEHLRYVPSIVRTFKDWKRFLRDYLFLKGKGAVFSLRNGIQIATSEPHDVATLVVVFAKREYGTVPEDATIVDLGANIGAFSIYAAASTERSIVYAYEPEPHNFGLLTRNITLNGMDGRIHPMKLAVTGREETRPLYLSESPLHSLYRQRPNQASIEVPCIGLADLFDRHSLDRIDLLKIDCEGAEFEILYGAPTARLQSIGAIRMEVNVARAPGSSFAELQAFLESHGFELELRPTKAAVAWFRSLEGGERKPGDEPRHVTGPEVVSPEALEPEAMTPRKSLHPRGLDA